MVRCELLTFLFYVNVHETKAVLYRVLLLFLFHKRKMCMMNGVLLYHYEYTFYRLIHSKEILQVLLNSVLVI